MEKISERALMIFRSISSHNIKNVSFNKGVPTYCKKLSIASNKSAVSVTRKWFLPLTNDQLNSVLKLEI